MHGIWKGDAIPQVIQYILIIQCLCNIFCILYPPTTYFTFHIMITFYDYTFFFLIRP